MRSKTFYATVEVEAEYDIEFDDILDLIEDCSENELDEIREIIGEKEPEKNTENTKMTLDDEQKYELLKAAMRKYTYQQLADRLDIKPYEIF